MTRSFMHNSVEPGPTQGSVASCVELRTRNDVAMLNECLRHIRLQPSRLDDGRTRVIDAAQLNRVHGQIDVSPSEVGSCRHELSGPLQSRLALALIEVRRSTFTRSQPSAMRYSTSIPKVDRCCAKHLRTDSVI